MYHTIIINTINNIEIIVIKRFYFFGKSNKYLINILGFLGKSFLKNFSWMDLNLKRKSLHGKFYLYSIFYD